MKITAFSVTCSLLLSCCILHVDGGRSQNASRTDFEQALQATALLTCTKTNTNYKSTGTATLISPEGYLLSNFHVIQGTQKLTVELWDGSTHEATLIKEIPEQDLVLLHIPIINGPHLPLSSSNEVRLGQTVFAIGHPGKLRFVLTSGVVGGLEQKLDTPEIPGGMLRHLILTDVPTNPGSSGGPLLSEQGQLVGINTAISSTSGRFQGYSFAIGIETITQITKGFFTNENI